MKYFFVLLVVLTGIWLWRSNRQTKSKLKRQHPQAATQPLAMVRCKLCALHIPSVDAVRGKDGAYCSADHLQRAEP